MASCINFGQFIFRYRLLANTYFSQQMISHLQARKEKSKQIYVVRKNLQFDNAEVLLYEPVEKMPPFSRKTLVFVSPPSIPKQTMVHKLVDSNPDMFGRPIPCK